jgi:mRNA-degrading endonuclease RelE of RelBE toxin-antitoxin system
MNLQEQVSRIKLMMGVINENSMENKIKDLSDEERKFLKDFGTDPVLRKLMSSEEIKIVNKLVKKGMMEKGTSDDGKSNVIYYVDSFVHRRV